MTITPTTLSRWAGVAAVVAGLIFIGVQINHPHLDATSVTTTEVTIRNSLKVLMAVLAIVGITGMYLRQVKQSGKLGLVGYLLFGSCYFIIMCTSFVAAVVLPTIAGTDPSYVNDVLAAATNGKAAGDIGLLQQVIAFQGFAYLVGSTVFGIALYRARVLPRWAAALLAVGGLVSVALAVMPDAFYRFLAFPNGIAMIALGYSLWLTTRTEATAQPTASTDGGSSRQVPSEPARQRPRARPPHPFRRRTGTGSGAAPGKLVGPRQPGRAGCHPGPGRRRASGRADRRSRRAAGGPALRRVAGPARRTHRGRHRLCAARRVPVLRPATPTPPRLASPRGTAPGGTRPRSRSLRPVDDPALPSQRGHR